MPPGGRLLGWRDFWRAVSKDLCQQIVNSVHFINRELDSTLLKFGRSGVGGVVQKIASLHHGQVNMPCHLSSALIGQQFRHVVRVHVNPQARVLAAEDGMLDNACARNQRQACTFSRVRPGRHCVVTIHSAQ